jgi:HAD superfamily hydrolase (TIGR01509 family)
MDGVVLDTEKLYTRFWMEAAQSLGFPMTRTQALGMRSLGGERAQSQLRSYFGTDADYFAIRQKRIELMSAFVEANGVEPKPGIRELLDALARWDLPRAITSSAALATIQSHLGSVALAQRFTALCSGKDVPRGKPAPDVYLHGAAVLGLPPESCLAIEDSPAGIEAAYRAGCLPVLIPDQDQPTEETLAMCFAKADSLTDVIGLLESLK